MPTYGHTACLTSAASLEASLSALLCGAAEEDWPRKVPLSLNHAPPPTPPRPHPPHRSRPRLGLHLPARQIRAPRHLPTHLQSPAHVTRRARAPRPQPPLPSRSHAVRAPPL